jgi:AP-2 complex subunit beta-1
MDPELVKQSIKAIGKIIFKLEKDAKLAVEIIEEIINGNSQTAIMETVVVAKDILRKFPGKYTALVKTLCQKIDCFYEPESKAAIIWILGEYAEKITDSEIIIG